MNGQGIHYRPNGTKEYEGNFYNRKRHGQGILYELNGKTIKHKGKFEHGKYINNNVPIINRDETFNEVQRREKQEAIIRGNYMNLTGINNEPANNEPTRKKQKVNNIIKLN